MSDKQPPTLTVVQASPGDVSPADTCDQLDSWVLAFSVVKRLDSTPRDQLGNLRGKVLEMSRHPGAWPLFLNNLLVILHEIEAETVDAG